MATVKKLIGRLPVYKGDWVAGTYSMLNQVSYLGSTFQSKIDNNTSQPATVVNNALQVNANWSVVSNGTAAYLADSRLTSVEGKTTVLEQDLNVVRGDVQGVVGYINTSTTAKIVRNNTYSVLFQAGTGGLQIGGTSWEQVGFEIAQNGYLYFNNQQAQELIFKPNPSQLIHASYYLREDNIAVAYVNGVRYELAANIPSNDIVVDYINALPSERDYVIINKRHFNTPLTQQQIDTMYNQGRCDEVVLGGEWRSTDINYIENDLINHCSIQNFGSTNPTLTQDGIKTTLRWSDIGSDTPRIRYTGECNFANCIAKMTFKASGDVNLNDGVVYFDTAAGNSIGYTPIDRIITESSGIYEYISFVKFSESLSKNPAPAIRGRGVMGSFSIWDFKIEKVGVLNEYLSSYLTPSKWIDTGVNKQDIPLTAPTFTYIRPYKQHLFGSGVPATPPDAAFVEYSDTATGNIWKSGTKPNTRQFAVTDWKQINN